MAPNVEKTFNMKTTGHIPLRYFHSLSANFTLQVRHRPISAALLPFSLKRISVKDSKNGHEKLQVR
jgi:hypothetical protein